MTAGQAGIGVNGVEPSGSVAARAHLRPGFYDPLADEPLSTCPSADSIRGVRTDGRTDG